MNNSKLAAVALFIFNRPRITSEVYECIRLARPSRFLVVADGPRPTRPEDEQLCRATRKVVSSPDWPCELLTHFAESNMGCRQRVSSGIDWVFQHCAEAIILEDDCLPHSSFFGFCSNMLRHYREDTRIMHVSGDNFHGETQRGTGSYYFSRYPFTWGWATWSRAWRYYDAALSLWPAASAGRWLESIFEDPLEIQHWSAVFDGVYRGEIDTWDYQWVFGCLYQSGLSILPNRNLISNIGVGPDATHFKDGHSTVGIPTRDLGECVHPAAIIRDREADRSTFKDHIRSRQSHGWLRRMARGLAVRTRIKRSLQLLRQ